MTHALICAVSDATLESIEVCEHAPEEPGAWLASAAEVVNYYVSKANETLAQAYGKTMTSPVLECADYERPLSIWVQASGEALVRITPAAIANQGASALYHGIPYCVATLVVALMDGTEAAKKVTDRFIKVMTLFGQPVLGQAPASQALENNHAQRGESTEPEACNQQSQEFEDQDTTEEITSEDTVPDRAHDYAATIEHKDGQIESELYVVYRCGCRRHRIDMERHLEFIRGVDFRCRNCHQRVVMAASE